MEPKVGTMVQFQISKDLYRPMLVLHVFSPECINGILFIDLHDPDLNLPDGGNIVGGRMVIYRSSSKGDKVGNWRFIP